MPNARELLRELQNRISQTNEPNTPVEWTHRLTFNEIQNQVYVDFYGTPFDEPYGALLEALCLPEIAGVLRSLTLRGPDEGANGTRNSDLTYLIESEAVFPQLETVFIESTAPEHHNQSIIGVDYDEDGQIGKVLNKAPALQSLTVPSAPDASFFHGPAHPLRFLRVDSGYAHQDFVLNFSQSSRFPQLALLDFGDYNQRYMENYEKDCTPFAHYEALFRSAAFSTLKQFILRNSILSSEQLAHLRTLQSGPSFYVIQEYGDYVR